MKKSILAMLITVMLGACDRPLELPEVNNENCQMGFISQWAEENNLTEEQMWEFIGKCSGTRGRISEDKPFERSEEKVW